MRNEVYRVMICGCEIGPYVGARKAGTPDRCEICGFITPEQWDAIREQVLEELTGKEVALIASAALGFSVGERHRSVGDVRHAMRRIVDDT